MRHVSHATIGGLSAAFLAFNRGKRSIVLDLSRTGREVAIDLVRQADVVVENFSTGVMERLGLGYEAFGRQSAARLLLGLSLRPTGALAHRSGYDPVIQAESGLMSLNGFAEGPPVRIGPPVVDISTGMMACNAVLAGLLARQHTGRGQHVETALFDTASTLGALYGMTHLINGSTSPRFGHAPPGASPVGLFQAKDAAFYLPASTIGSIGGLVVDVLDRPDMADDPRFATNRDRSANWQALVAELDRIFSTLSRAEWIARLQAANVPAGPVRTIAEAFASPEMAARGLAARYRTPRPAVFPTSPRPFVSHTRPTVDPVVAPVARATYEEPCWGASWLMTRCGWGARHRPAHSARKTNKANKSRLRASSSTRGGK